MACFFRDAVDAPGLPAPEDSLAGLKLLKILGRPELPFEFAGHRVLRELASGGMGTVYEAEQLQLKRTVALKLVRSSAFARTEELQRFRAEAETVARLDHPNIVPVYEVGESGGQPYFTMKLLPGGTLADRLNEWTEGNRFGWIFGREVEDTFSLDGQFVGFDLTDILDSENPLFH